MDGPGKKHEVSPTVDSGEGTRDLPNSIEEFPTTNQPVMDTVLKDMFMSLGSSLQTDLASYMHRFSTELQAVENRVEHIESKMGEFTTTINDLIDAHEGKDKDMEWVKANLANMKDRSRCNNMKIRGVPENVQQADL